MGWNKWRAPGIWSLHNLLKISCFLKTCTSSPSVIFIYAKLSPYFERAYLYIYQSLFSLAWNEYGHERPQYQHWEIEWHFPAWWVARKMTALRKSDLYSYLNFCAFPIIISWRYTDLIGKNEIFCCYGPEITHGFYVLFLNLLRLICLFKHSFSHSVTQIMNLQWKKYKEKN